MTSRRALDDEEITAALERGGTETTADGLPVVSTSHDIETPVGRVRVQETVGRGAWARAPRRAALMLPGPVAIGSFHRIPVPGYDAATVLDAEGFACVTVDLLGTGDSEHPEDGRTCTIGRQVEALEGVIEALRELRGYAPMAAIGESWGGAIASHLAAKPALVSACVISSALFRTSTPAVDQMARAPQMRAMLDGIPDGYLPVDEQIWGPLSQPMPPEVAEWTMATQRRRYTSAPMYAVLDIPYFDPSRAQVPGLVIRGGADPLVAQEDSVELAEAYGGPATQLSIPGAGHIPRVEEAARGPFWDAVTGFLRKHA